MALAAIEAFVGIGAVYGGINLIVDAEGFGVERAWLDGSPFSSYTIPGLALLVVIGGGMLAAAALAVRGSGLAAAAAVMMGAITLAFLVVETLVIGYQGADQIPLVAVIGIASLALIGLGGRTLL